MFWIKKKVVCKMKKSFDLNAGNEKRYVPLHSNFKFKNQDELLNQ